MVAEAEGETRGFQRIPPLVAAVGKASQLGAMSVLLLLLLFLVWEAEDGTGGMLGMAVHSSTCRSNALSGLSPSLPPSLHHSA